jgi:hypothetical protein
VGSGFPPTAHQLLIADPFDTVRVIFWFGDSLATQGRCEPAQNRYMGVTGNPE